MNWVLLANVLNYVYNMPVMRHFSHNHTHYFRQEVEIEKEIFHFTDSCRFMYYQHGIMFEITK